MNRYRYSEYHYRIAPDCFTKFVYFEAADDYYALDELDCRYEEGSCLYADVYRLGSKGELLEKII